VTASLLQVDGLTKRFGGITAVDGCSFGVPAGTISALIGPNGSGKTTVFNLTTGYLHRDAGAIVFDGRAVGRPDPMALYRRGLTRTFQQARVFRNLTLVENLCLGAPKGWTALLRRDVVPGDRARAMEILAEFGLTDLAEAPAGELSYGQQKLLEFASVLISRPKLVMLDEPTAGVNPVMVESLERHIRELHRRGITFLVVEHDMNLVMRLCDPVIVMDHGTKLAEGAPENLRSNPAVLDAYLGD
jgi:ABC-type branched-subunit amino acid transport system ATPase component